LRGLARPQLQGCPSRSARRAVEATQLAQDAGDGLRGLRVARIACRRRRVDSKALEEEVARLLRMHRQRMPECEGERATAERSARARLGCIQGFSAREGRGPMMSPPADTRQWYQGAVACFCQFRE